MKRQLTFAYPGDLNLKTGGYGYDRAMLTGLKALGWDVDLLALGDGFPAPAESVKREAERRLSSLPDGSLVMVDGLAFGILDEWAERNASRLSIVALVHHPLALETGPDETTRVRLRTSERQALAATRHVVVTSPNTARELVAHFGVPAGKVTIALPGTERAPVSVCDGNPPRILSIGTLIPRKGHDVLINALAQIEDLSWTATIVGSKSLHPATSCALEAQIADLGLGGRVCLLGECDDVRALLARADMFALASRYEGYGMVFAEALSQGVPVVACHAGAIPDVVPSDAGLLVPVDDVDAFAHALRSLLSDTSLHQRLAQGARRAGEALPEWEDTARTISSVLEECL